MEIVLIVLLSIISLCFICFFNKTKNKSFWMVGDNHYFFGYYGLYI